MFRRATLGLVGASALLSLAPAVAQAQDWRGTPVYGSVRLSAGFTPDPHEISLTAGGPVDAGRINGANCTGQIGTNPDYVLNYSADDMGLYIRASSNGDTSLAVRDPQGRWHCNDDTNGLDPEVGFGDPMSGRYAIWVGAVGETTANATLQISEISHNSGSSYGGEVDMGATANFGEVILRSGFTPDPHQIEMTAGGSIDASDLSSRCMGMISSAPDYEITYRDAGNYPLAVTFRSSADTTLVINAPDGQWYCDDDSAGKFNPRVSFADAMDGVYDIWVGTISGEMAGGVLSISEIQ